MRVQRRTSAPKRRTASQRPKAARRRSAGRPSQALQRSPAPAPAAEPDRSTVLTLSAPPEQQPAVLTRFLADGITHHAINVMEWTKTRFHDPLDLSAMREQMAADAAVVRGGDLSGVETLLLSQAQTLNAIFLAISGRAVRNQDFGQYERNLRLAFRAQGQCRATLETLAMVKNPPVFARQANIANGPQQINNQGSQVVNGGGVPARAGQQPLVQSKLLEADNGGERVDGREAGATSAGDPSVEAVAVLDGAAHS